MEKLSFNQDELKDVKGYEGLYAVTKDGRVWSYPKEWVSSNGSRHRHNGKWLKTGKKKNFINNCVSLCCDGVQKIHLVSWLVAWAYLENPYNKKYVCHIDMNNKSNGVDNLIWRNEEEHYKSRLIHGFGKRKNSTKILQYTRDNIYIKHYESIKSASIDTGIRRSNISACLAGVRRRAGDYVWKYYKD